MPEREPWERPTTNPANRLIPPKGEYRDPRFLTDGEYRRLKLQVAHRPRDAAIVELVLQTGIRLTEPAQLTLRDVALPRRINDDEKNTGELVVRQGKGRRDRTLSLNYLACQALHTYLLVRPPVVTNALFVSKFKRPIAPRGFQWILEKHYRAAGIDRASVHSLRHTYGTHSVKSGMNLRVVQEMMGHANLATTSRYVSLARELMDREVQQHALK
jgi:integrase/recombinase XerD